jgi:hypothetical protein
VPDTVKGFGEVHRLNDDVRVGFKESCFDMEEMNESYGTCGRGCSGL